MALLKNKVIRGVTCPYWKIIDCNVKTGFVAIAPYVNQEAAQTRENMMEGRTSFQIDFPVDVTAPLAYAYSKIKESKKEVRVITEAIEEVKDVNGVVTQEAVPAVTEEVETNWFANSEDV